MILRFEGGPMDGLEEESPGEPPFMVLRTPPASVMARAVMTGDPDADAEPPDFSGVYQLFGVAAGVATYRQR